MKWSDSTTGRDTVSFDQDLFGGQPNAPVHLGASPLMSGYCYNRNNTHDPKIIRYLEIGNKFPQILILRI